MTEAALPLAGVRVVEMSHMILGPSCGMILRQLGAEVIKVEPPGGDKTRSLGGMGISFFPLFNRGKRSVVLDLERAEDRQALERLLGTADVFLENFRDGQLARHALDAESLRRRFPRLIVAGHKGFLSGPYEHRPALDEVVQMMSGLAVMTGSRERPQRVGSSANDIMGGMFGAIGVIAALLRRKETGEGATLRVGLFENCLMMVAQHMVEYEITGVPALPMSERRQAWPIYDIFETADGQRLFVAVVTEANWQTFCRAFELETLLDDPGLRTTNDRIQARPRVLPLVAERLKRHSLEELVRLLDRLAISFAPINRPEELFDDPHVQRPGGLVAAVDDKGRTLRVPALPLEFDGAGLGEGLRIPALGADTAAVLAELGLDAAPKGMKGQDS